MKSFCKLTFVLFVITTFAAAAKPLTLTTNKGFELKTDYFASSKKSERAVLMLHQCNFNRSMYEDIGEQLAQQGIHAFSLDFRGFGDSINTEFDIEKLQSLPQEQRRPAWQKMSAEWPADVQLAYDFLREKITADGVIGVIGASCGGSQAITLAENNPVKVISFFSSAQREQNIARYQQKLADKPTLIIAAEEDGMTYTSAQELFKIAKHSNSKFISYKGIDHGYPLLDKDPVLAKVIVGWFSQQL